MRPPVLEVVLFEKSDSGVERLKAGETSQESGSPGKIVVGPLKGYQGNSAALPSKLPEIVVQTNSGGNGAGAGSLGINTKFVHAGLKRAVWAPGGVSIVEFSVDDLRVYRRALRWQRLRAVQFILNGQRVEKCYRVRIAAEVEVWRSSKYKRAHYKQLMICGSVWACPVCSAKITERRKIELENAPRLNEFSKFMVTYTIQHNRGDDLKDLHADLVAGLRMMKNSRGYKDLIKRLHIVGTVRGMEVTVSNINGWHPHIHELGFSTLDQGEINAEELREELSYYFIKAMQKRGRYVHDEIGVNVRTDHVVASYVAKMGEGEKSQWGAIAEITKSPVKAGRDEDHFHPFELLDMVIAKNKDAERMYIEYAVTMKGKRQLSYSPRVNTKKIKRPGLRELLGMDVEISDQEIAERIDADAALFAMIEPEHWNNIVIRELRGQLLEVASTGNYSAFVAWMRAIGCKDYGG